MSIQRVGNYVESVAMKNHAIGLLAFVMNIFIEPYYSDACEIYYEGSIVNPNAGVKDRFAYVDAPAVNGSLPATANRGHLLVNFERPRLIYKGLFDFVETVLNAGKETEYGSRVKIEFPITASFAAHAVALFLKSHKSNYCDRILLEFVERMSVEHNVQIVQRIMAAMAINQRELLTVSAESDLMVRMNAGNDQSAEWDSYKERIGFGNLSRPARTLEPIPWDDEEVLPNIESLIEDMQEYEADEREDGEDLWRLDRTYEGVMSNFKTATEEGSIVPSLLASQDLNIGRRGRPSSSTSNIQPSKEGRNSSSEEPATRSPSPVTDPKGGAPVAKASTRGAGVVHPTTGILEPVKESEAPRRSARLVSGQVPAGIRGTGSRTQAIAREQGLQLRPNNRLPPQTELVSNAPPKKRAKTPTKKAKI